MQDKVTHMMPKLILTVVYRLL